MNGGIEIIEANTIADLRIRRIEKNNYLENL